MAERPELAFMNLLITILLLFVASPTQAQTFNTPYLNTPTGMVKGISYTITCNCISVGTAVTIAFKRSDQISSFSGNPACNIISNTQDTWFCVGEYTFTARTEDIGVNVTCSATQQGDPTPKTDSAVLRVRVPPPSPYPEITGPDTVTANENNTWTCVVDGALPAATIRWRIGATNVYTNGVTHPTTENSEGLFRTSSSISNVFLSSGGIAQIHCDMEHDTGARKTATKNVQVQYKPIITSTPTSYNVTEGVTQRLECSINAVPTATVVGWLKDNTAVDRSSGKYSGGNSFSNPDLDIVNPQKEDSGVYVCTATNILGSTNGPDVTVTVRYKPKVSIPNDNYDGNFRGSLTIPCNIDANPGVNIVSWRRISTSNLITTLSIPSSGGKYSGGTQSAAALTINNLDVSDALRYQCVASNTVGNGESNIVNVIISYAPTNIQVNPQSVRVYVGQAVTVSCFADGVPTPTYAWYFESNTKAVSTGQTLSIPSAQPADNGQYTCLATNTIGNASIVVAVSVWYAPILTTNTSPQAVDEGSTLTLKCTIDANPSTYSVSWLKDGAIVNRTNTRLSGGTDSITPDLTITNIQSVDAGSYGCRVTHIVATSRSDIVDVHITFPPRNIVLNPADPVINLDEGNALNLTCSVDAAPTPTITWKAGSTVIGSGSSLVIASAGPVDNREVTCEVTNSRGSITKKTRINVSYKPRGSVENPVFRTTVGTAVTLTCQVIANPLATDYSWSFDGVDLNDTGSSLVVRPKNGSDFGQYTCLATNKVGTSDPIDITLEMKTTDPGLTNKPEEPASASLSTALLVLIILFSLALIILIIIVIVICWKKDKFCKKNDKTGRVAPISGTNSPDMSLSPRSTAFPGGVGSEAVSRQHVTVDVNGPPNKDHDNLSMEYETTVNGTLANGSVVDNTINEEETPLNEATSSGAIEGGTIDDGTMDGGTIADGTIDDGTIADGTIDDGTISGGALAGGVVEGGAVAGGAVAGGAMAGGAVTDKATKSVPDKKPKSLKRKKKKRKKKKKTKPKDDTDKPEEKEAEMDEVKEEEEEGEE